MNKKIRILFMISFLFMLTPHAFAEEGALIVFIKKKIQGDLLALSRNMIVVNAVEDANKKGLKTSVEINYMDKKWKETEGVDEWIKGFLTNPCARYLKVFQQKTMEKNEKLYSEIFVMDQQGNIVAETDKTSDFWQGDEDKFIQSFLDGKGAIFVDKPSYDVSSKTYLVHFSFPIFSPGGSKAAGVMTAGINLDAFVDRYIY